MCVFSWSACNFVFVNWSLAICCLFHNWYHFLSAVNWSFILLFMYCYLLVRSFESWCVYIRGSCDSQSWFVYREWKWWFSYATKCGEFLNCYIWGHKAIIYFYHLKSLFFPQHASALVTKKKCVFSLSAYNFFYAKHWFFIMSCYLLLVKRL